MRAQSSSMSVVGRCTNNAAAGVVAARKANPILPRIFPANASFKSARRTPESMVRASVFFLRGIVISLEGTKWREDEKETESVGGGGVRRVRAFFFFLLPATRRHASFSFSLTLIHSSLSFFLFFFFFQTNKQTKKTAHGLPSPLGRRSSLRSSSFPSCGSGNDNLLQRLQR